MIAHHSSFYRSSYPTQAGCASDKSPSDQQTTPSWLDDPTVVSSWLRNSAMQKIRALSTTYKLRMLGTLLAPGDLPSENLIGTIRLLQSVYQFGEAKQLRDAIDLGRITREDQQRSLGLALYSLPR